MRHYLFVVLLLISATIASAQSQLFEKINRNAFLSSSVTDKLIVLVNKPEVLNSEQLNYVGPANFTKGYKGVFNIFNYNLGFVVTDDYGINAVGIHGYTAELNSGGYAIISISSSGIGANIFYKGQIFEIRPISQNIHLITEINNQKMGTDIPNDVLKPNNGKIVNCRKTDLLQ